MCLIGKMRKANIATFSTVSRSQASVGICEIAGEEGQGERRILLSFVFFSNNLKTQSARLHSGAQEFFGIFLSLLTHVSKFDALVQYFRLRAF